MYSASLKNQQLEERRRRRRRKKKKKKKHDFSISSLIQVSFDVLSKGRYKSSLKRFERERGRKRERERETHATLRAHNQAYAPIDFYLETQQI